MAINHPFVSGKAQGSDPSLVSKNEWNQDHVITDYFNLKARGSAGDNATNDSAAILAAIAAADATGGGGGNIFVPYGYTFLTDRIVRSSALPLRFFGGGTLKLHNSGSPQNALIEISGGGKVTLDNIVLDGNNLALTGDAWGLATVTSGELICRNVEVKNSGHCGLASNTGGRLTVTGGSNIHDCASFGVHVQGTGRAILTDSYYKDLGDSAVFAGPDNNGSVATVSDGVLIHGNVIRDIRADDGGTGQHGNGINVFKLDNVCIGPNDITNVAFSFVRVNNASKGGINGIVGAGAGEVGIWAELGANRYLINGCAVSNCQSHGICATNVNNGAYALQINNCNVNNFGLAGGVRAGIIIEHGKANDNYVDGNGNAGAVWAVKCSPGGGTALSWQTQVSDNQTAGCKYDIGVAASVSAGTQRMVISRTMNVRKDANYSSPIGAVGGSDSDAGNGSAIAVSIYPKVFWDRNYFDVPTAEKPVYAEVGATMKINGVWLVSNGTSGWA